MSRVKEFDEDAVFLKDSEVDAKAGEGFDKIELLLTDLIRKGQENGDTVSPISL